MNTRTKPATKQQIKAAIQATTGHMKFKVHAQGVTFQSRYESRKPSSMGFTTKVATRMQPNGRFSVTVWGGNANSAMRQMIAGLQDAGYVVESVNGDSFHVHNGTVADLDGVLRWEGTY